MIQSHCASCLTPSLIHTLMLPICMVLSVQPLIYKLIQDWLFKYVIHTLYVYKSLQSPGPKSEDMSVLLTNHVPLSVP